LLNDKSNTIGKNLVTLEIDPKMDFVALVKASSFHRASHFLPKNYRQGDQMCL
jgi:hypothetical protein